MLQLDLLGRQARWQGRTLKLSDRAFDLLQQLARQPGQLMTSEVLQRALWPGQRVDAANLRVHIGVLRRELGPLAVLTVVGRGYLLALPVGVHASNAESTGPGHRLSGPLPLQPDAPIGRDEPVAQLGALLKLHRLVSLLGPGGIGKTRVALHFAHLQRALGGGLVWVDLSTLPPEAEDVIPRLCRAVAEAGGLQWASDTDAWPAHRLGQLLHQAGEGQESLLVLDGAEQLCAPLAGLLETLLAAAPALRVLVTTQHALPLPFGQTVWLPPLDVPAVGATAAAVRASAAAQLLLRRAQAVHPQWQPQATDWPDIGALVRALEGLPLALELAAAGLPLRNAAALRAQLLDRLMHRSLEGQPERLQDRGDDRAAAPPRQRTLHAALDWSFSLLPPAEQTSLCQLSVFAAPFRLDTAVQALQLDGLDTAGLEAVVQRLVMHSMIQLLPSEPPSTLPGTPPDAPPGAPPRLRMADTTRLFARHRLHAQGPGALAGCLQRHGQAMAALARQATAELDTLSDAAWLARWLPDHGDWQGAFDHAHERGDADVAADIIEALVLGANVTGGLQPALQRWQATRQLAEQARPLARAKLLGWGNLARTADTTRHAQSSQRVQAWRRVAQGPLPAADDTGLLDSDGRSEAHSSDDATADAARRGLCVALAMHAAVCQDSGDPGAADTALAECLALESADWPPRQRRRCSWYALTRLAMARNDDALLARAGRQSARMAAELQQLGAQREYSLVLGQQALMLRLRGQSAQAAGLLAQAAQLQLSAGCALDAGRSLGLQCAAMAEQLEADEAVAAARPAADLLQHACSAAVRALALLEPYPELVVQFADALAALAARCGEPELAAQLLAGAQQQRWVQQHSLNQLAAAAGQRALQQVHVQLDADTLAHCTRQGQALSADALRRLALRGLTRHGADLLSPLSPASAPPG